MFSPDGKLLYATENDFDNAAGMIGIYDASDRFRRIGEFPTHGDGPARSASCLPTARTLAIANGGIETHPDFGRAEAQHRHDEAILVFVDRLTGDLIEKHELAPALHQLSIRHMDARRRRDVWFGCQYRGPPETGPPLVGRVRRGKSFSSSTCPRMC